MLLPCTDILKVTLDSSLSIAFHRRLYTIDRRLPGRETSQTTVDVVLELLNMAHLFSSSSDQKALEFHVDYRADVLE